MSDPPDLINHNGRSLISVFMLGKGVLFEQSGTEQFNVTEQIAQFQGDRCMYEIPRSGGIRHLPYSLDG